MALSQIRMSSTITAVHDAASPGDGGVLQELVDSVLLTNGVGDFQADLIAKKTYTIAGSGTQDIDFTTLTDAFGTALAAAEIVGLKIKNNAFLSDGTTASGGQITVTPHATNGWTGLIAAAGDIVKVAVGGSFTSESPRTGLAVSGSSKVVTLGNANSGSVYVTIIVLARSS